MLIFAYLTKKLIITKFETILWKTADKKHFLIYIYVSKFIFSFYLIWIKNKIVVLAIFS